jgi:hypothetical protein
MRESPPNKFFFYDFGAAISIKPGKLLYPCKIRLPGQDAIQPEQHKLVFFGAGIAVLQCIVLFNNIINTS